jgi:hypothetical protein
VCIKIEVNAKVEQAARDGLAVNCEVLLLKMPSSGASDECWKGTISAELVLLLALFEVDLPADGVVKV